MHLLRLVPSAPCTRDKKSSRSRCPPARHTTSFSPCPQHKDAYASEGPFLSAAAVRFLRERERMCESVCKSVRAASIVIAPHKKRCVFVGPASPGNNIQPFYPTHRWARQNSFFRDLAPLGLINGPATACVRLPYPPLPWLQVTSADVCLVTRLVFPEGPKRVADRGMI